LQSNKSRSSAFLQHSKVKINARWHGGVHHTVGENRYQKCLSWTSIYPTLTFHTSAYLWKFCRNCDGIFKLQYVTW
jgi:hypothetical protein